MAKTGGLQLPPPYKGQNDQFPAFALSNPYCVKMLNFNNKKGSINLRQGNKFWGATTGTAIISLDLSSYTSGTSALFMLIDKNTGLVWYDISAAGVVTSVHTLGTEAGVAFPVYFNNYLFYFGNSALSVTGTGPQYFNGTTWGTAAYTWPANFNPYGGNVYKNRGYFLEDDSAAYVYTEVDAISGVTTKVDLSSVLSTRAQLYIIRSISLSEGVTQQNVQAFCFSSGEILVYSGSYPNSANWELIARLQISKPIFNNSVVDAKGDSFILTQSEILSLRNIFARGYSQEKADGIGAAIKNRWTQIIKAYFDAGGTTSLYIKGVYDEANDRLVISLPNYVDPVSSAIVANTAFQLIYDFTLQAWYEHIQTDTNITQATSACYFRNKVFYCTHNAARNSAFSAQIEGATTWLDDQLDGSGTNPIAFDLISAPHPLSKFGVTLASGLEAIMKTDMYSAVNFTLIGDLGAVSNGPQLSNGNGSNMSKILANVGIEANAIQYQISGNSVSSSVGLELHATNLWVSQAEGLAR